MLELLGSISATQALVGVITLASGVGLWKHGYSVGHQHGTVDERMAWLNGQRKLNPTQQDLLNWENYK